MDKAVGIRALSCLHAVAAPANIPVLLIWMLASCVTANAAVLQVGPAREIKTPQEAAQIAKDGDVIHIDPGKYRPGSAIWRANSLRIIGLGRGAVLDASGASLPEIKAIWVIKGNSTQIENITFSGARSPDRNGAGIRQEGRGLHIRNCRFLDNETGLLAGANPESEIAIEYSKFSRNGHADGQAHNIYIGAVKSLVMQFNHIHAAKTGSQIKSRALKTRIAFNRIDDGPDASTNYGIDISNGGVVEIIGNLIRQNARTGNRTMLSFAPEGPAKRAHSLLVIHNTFVNFRPLAQFMSTRGRFEPVIHNNLFVGPGRIIDRDGRIKGNVHIRQKSLGQQFLDWLSGNGNWSGLDGDGPNYRVSVSRRLDAADFLSEIKADSPARDVGVRLEYPVAYEYRHPRSRGRRLSDGYPDAGAMEFVD